MMLETDTARFLLGVMWQQLWIGSALVLLVGVCLRMLRRLNAATRHWIWALTLLTMALLPLAALLPAGPVSPAAVGIPERGLERALPVAEQRPTLAFPDEGSAEHVGPLPAIGQSMARPAATRVLGTSLLMLWLAGTLWMLLGLFRSARFAARLRRESRKAPLPARQADIRLSALARTPMVVGLRRPAILIPLPLFERVSRQELQRVLDHELAHVRRRDQWLMLLQKLIEALYFFHPAVRYAARRLDDEREISCDDRAALGQRNRYAGNLIRICQAIVAKPSPAVLAVGAVRSPNQLSRRIACLLDGKRNHAPDASRASVALSALLLVAAMAFATEFMPRVAKAEEPQYQRESERRDFGTPLIAAAAAGDVALMRELIESGADVNEAFTRFEPRTPLNAAARGGHLDAVRLLLNRGAEVDRVVPGDATALIDAARNGHVDVVALLLESGADANRAVRGDGSPLIAAATSGRAEAVRLILAQGADPNLAVAGDGSALAAASARGDDEIIDLLLAHGADPDVITVGDPAAMMEAAARGDIGTLERLATAGGDVNRVSPGDGTPLIAAARHGSLPATAWLLDHGADANRAARGDGNPLIMAAAQGHTDVLRLLLDHGAQIDAIVPGDETALIASARSGAIESVRLLLERGADVNIAVPVGGGIFGEQEMRTALNQAEARGHDDIVALIKAHGARH